MAQTLVSAEDPAASLKLVGDAEAVGTLTDTALVT